MPEPSEDRILYLLKSHGALTAGHLGKWLGMTAMGARQHLLKLEGQGLVGSEDRREARGRPKKYWYLADKGHGRFPDRHSVLTVELLQSIRVVFGPSGLEQLIGHREQASLAHYRERLRSKRSLRAKVAELARLRDEEGYMASWRQDADGSFLLIENHCPICAAATSCQSLCRSELEIFRAALGEGVAIERLDHIPVGARRCVYRIRALKDG